MGGGALPSNGGACGRSFAARKFSRRGMPSHACRDSEAAHMMCRSDPSFAALKTALAEQGAPFGPLHAGGPAAAVNPAVALAEYQRLQIYDYGRLRFPYACVPYGLEGVPQWGPAFPGGPFARFDPRRCFAAEEPKPQHSYIGLIAMAILSCPERKMVLSDIYQYILDQYPYFRNRGPGWRNSIRHNLSLNDCFVKAGRSANGKGHYWAIHPANVEDFRKGDFRRRKAQRKVRKHMGLAVPDDDDSPAPSPPPRPPMDLADPHHKLPVPVPKLTRQKRQFDMESLLAPDPVPSSSSPSVDCDSPRMGGSFPHSPGPDSPRDNPLLFQQQQQHQLVNPAVRRAMQWSTLPLQTVGLPQRMPAFVGWPAAAQQAANILSFSSRSVQQDLAACTAASQLPLVHRWQDAVSRLEEDKIGEQ